MSNVIDALERGTLPFAAEGRLSFMERQQVIERFGMWALLTWDFVQTLARHLQGKRVLEVFSGTGWLAWALGQKGVNVLATDDYSWHFPIPPKVPVQKMDAVQAVKRYRRWANVLLMCWPPMGLAAERALEQWPPGRAVVYIGEPRGGCTASEGFFDLFVIDKVLHIDQWDGLHDYCFIGHRAPLSRTHLSK